MNKTKQVQNLDEELWNQFVGLCKMKNTLIGVELNKILKKYLEKEGVL